MKNKQTHISRIIICLLIAGAAFVGGMIYGEKTERRRISEGFIKTFQEQFGSDSMQRTGSGSDQP